MYFAFHKNRRVRFQTSVHGTRVLRPIVRDRIDDSGRYFVAGRLSADARKAREVTVRIDSDKVTENFSADTATSQLVRHLRSATSPVFAEPPRLPEIHIVHKRILTDRRTKRQRHLPFARRWGIDPSGFSPLRSEPKSTGTVDMNTVYRRNSGDFWTSWITHPLLKNKEKIII